MAFFRPAPRRRCPALTSGPNCTKLGFLGFCRPFHRNRALETGNTSISRLPQFCSLEQLLAFFRPAPRRRCPALTSGPNYTKLGFLCFCRPFHLNRALETGRHHYQQIGTVLAFFLAFFRLSQRRCFSALTLGPNCTKLGFLGFCRPFQRNWVLEAEKYQY